MDIFISWSGPRSRKVADFLFNWLKKLPLTINPWISHEAIDPGTRWEKELSAALEETRFGILCLTPENQLEPWICFEAGALAKTIEKTHVIPYLIDMKPEDLKQPLKQFQAIKATKENTLKLIKTIHKVSGDETRSQKDLEEAFEIWWPKLEAQIDVVKNEKKDQIEIEDLDLPQYTRKGIDKILSIVESLSSRLLELEKKGLHVRPYWHTGITDTTRGAPQNAFFDYISKIDPNESSKIWHTNEMTRLMEIIEKQKKALSGRVKKSAKKQLIKKKR